MPCSDCVTRAARNPGNGNLALCQRCIDNLRQPRGRRKEIVRSRQAIGEMDANTRSALDINTSSPRLPWSDDWSERHALQFFSTHSAPELAGYFDSPFWQQTILQAGRHEPAVMHAIAAVGAMHERLLLDGPTLDEAHDPQTKFALEQCNKSIRCLTQEIRESKKPPNTRLLLTTSVLFVCFEAIQNRWQEAIQHAEQGYNLLQHHARSIQGNADDASAFAVGFDQLRAILMRLHFRAMAVTDQTYNFMMNSESTRIAKPKHFETLHDARVSLELVATVASVMFLDLELDDGLYNVAASQTDMNTVFRPWLQAWEGAFSRLLAATLETMSPADHKAAMVLEANALVVHVFSNVDLSRDELGWVLFHDKFRAIVDLAAAVLEDGSSKQPSLPQRPHASFISSTNVEHAFSLGIIVPLCQVCARCQDPAIQARALDLLKRYSRRECMWSSWSAWKVEEYLLGVEEQGNGKSSTGATGFNHGTQDNGIYQDMAEASHLRDRATKLKRVRSGRNIRRELNPGLFVGEGIHMPMPNTTYTD